MAKVMVRRRHLDERSISGLQGTLEQLQRQLADLAPTEDPHKAEIAAITERLNGIEERLQQPVEREAKVQRDFDAGPIVSALQACEGRIDAVRADVAEIRTRRRKWEFDIHKDGDRITGATAYEVDAAPGEERLEDVVAELEAIEKTMRETPAVYLADEAMRARYAEVLRIEEQAINKRR